MSIAAKLLASGTGWSVNDFVCTSGPRHPCYVEHRDEHRVAAALRRIEAQQGGRLPVDALAAEAAVSPFHFLCIFEQVVGVTPGQYMLRMRLRSAAVRLRRSRDAVATVALDCGFDELSSCNRQFRRATGLTPGAYRARRVPLG
jgi:transcriptional regulator GlxA family with amidase domain